MLKIKTIPNSAKNGRYKKVKIYMAKLSKLPNRGDILGNLNYLEMNIEYFINTYVKIF